MFQLLCIFISRLEYVIHKSATRAYAMMKGEVDKTLQSELYILMIVVVPLYNFASRKLVSVYLFILAVATDSPIH